MTPENEEKKVATPPLTAAELDLKLREFLVSYSLYRTLAVELDKGVNHVDFPKAISVRCTHKACVDEPATTWEQVEMGQVSPGWRYAYRCVHCRESVRTYWVMVFPVRVKYEQLPNGRVPRGYDVFQIRKIGQWPAWSIAVPKEIERALSADDQGLYRNGLICMSQAYGIGALAYFRRVVENAVNSLLDLVEEAANADGDKAALDQVAKARGSKVADEKLRLISEVVPASLRPAGVNPFSNLYGDYSRGLHALTDDECLKIAADLREALEYVFGQMRDKLEQAKAYRAKILARAK